jgi:hypothetical protein
MSERLKASAFAVLTVVIAYGVAFAFGRLGSSWQIFLPLDILVYLGIGFFSARALGEWRSAFMVVLIAVLVDQALDMGSYILPTAPRMSPAAIAEAGTVDMGFNLLVGLVGSAIGARVAMRGRAKDS